MQPDNRFQIVKEYDVNELIYNEDYLDKHRSPDLVVVHITAINRGSPSQKKALFKAIADRLGANPGLRPQDVQVIISSKLRWSWPGSVSVAAGGLSATHTNLFLRRPL